MTTNFKTIRNTASVIMLLLTISYSYSQDIVTNEEEIQKIIKYNDVSKLENLLKDGLKPDTKIKVKVRERTDYDFMLDEYVYKEKQLTLAEVASKNGKSEIVKLLIKHGADIDGDSGERIINDFLMANDGDMVLFLIPKHIKPGLENLELASLFRNFDLFDWYFANLRDEVSDEDKFKAILTAAERCYLDQNYARAVTYLNQADQYDYIDKEELYYYRALSNVEIGEYQACFDDTDKYLKEIRGNEYSKNDKIGIGHIFALRGLCKAKLGENKDSYYADFKKAEELGFRLQFLKGVNEYYP